MPVKPLPTRKSEEKVPWFDCYSAPCRGGCPISQDIPEYLELCRKGLYNEALALITERNALPFITGTICAHRCMGKCTRNFYEDPVQIRAAKLLAAEKGIDARMASIVRPAPVPGKLNIPGNVRGVIGWMQERKAGSNEPLGHVAVVGGGNTAMDAARVAKRGGAASVTLVYRRTRRFMPADAQELELAMQDGVDFLELAAPIKQENGVLTCEKMRLGEPDASGRRSPVPTGETVELPCDLVISAVGEQVEEQVFTDNGITLSAKGRPAFCTNVPGVYAAGDALRGPATVVEGIADAARFAEAVIGAPHTYDIPAEAHPTEAEAIARKGILRAPGKACCEGERCLSCDTVCQNCVDVCPNRANVAVRLPDGRTEIVHVDKMCNECGNCTAFCPYASEPCKDKLTLFQTTEDMDDSKNFGFCFLPDGKVRARLTTETVGDPDELPADAALLVRTIRDSYSYLYC